MSRYFGGGYQKIGTGYQNFGTGYQMVPKSPYNQIFGKILFWKKWKKQKSFSFMFITEFICILALFQPSRKKSTRLDLTSEFPEGFRLD